MDLVIKLKLQFGDGAVKYRCPVSYKELIHNHPVLCRGSSSTCLNDEVQEWLISTLGSNWKFKFEINDYYIWFKTESDRTMFQLRWLV